MIILFMRDLVNLILGIMVFNAVALAIPTYLLISLVSRRDVVGDYTISRLGPLRFMWLPRIDYCRHLRNNDYDLSNYLGIRFN